MTYYFGCVRVHDPLTCLEWNRLFPSFTCMSCNLSSKCAAGFVLRVSFGLSLLFVGVAHYMGQAGFSAMVIGGLGPLEPVGAIWAYLLPALQIVGGGLFVIGKYDHIAAWAAGLALGSIPAGMLMKSVLTGVALPDVMGAANNAFIWLLVYAVVVKFGCCKES